jgi:hypothetical protein
VTKEPRRGDAKSRDAGRRRTRETTDENTTQKKAITGDEEWEGDTRSTPRGQRQGALKGCQLSASPMPDWKGRESKGPMSCRRATRLILAMSRIPAGYRLDAFLHLQHASLQLHFFFLLDGYCSVHEKHSRSTFGERSTTWASLRPCLSRHVAEPPRRIPPRTQFPYKVDTSSQLGPRPPAEAASPREPRGTSDAPRLRLFT